MKPHKVRIALKHAVAYVPLVSLNQVFMQGVVGQGIFEYYGLYYGVGEAPALRMLVMNSKHYRSLGSEVAGSGPLLVGTPTLRAKGSSRTANNPKNQTLNQKDKTQDPKPKILNPKLKPQTLILIRILGQFAVHGPHLLQLLTEAHFHVCLWRKL